MEPTRAEFRTDPTVLVLTSSPNKDGLTAALGQASLDGVREAGGDAQIVDLNTLQIGRCQACGTGYGTCKTLHSCQVEDDFQDIHKRILSSSGFILVTPVYWGEPSESMRAFQDRLRRCEATRGEESGLRGKPAIAVAAAGGSGNGTVTCLLGMNQFLGHVRSDVFDLITVTRKSKAYKLEALRQAAGTMTAYLKRAHG